MADIRQEILAGRLRDAKVKALEAALEFEKQAKIAGLNTRPISLLEERDAHIETMVKSFWELFWQNYGSCATACALLGGFVVNGWVKNLEFNFDSESKAAVYDPKDDRLKIYFAGARADRERIKALAKPYRTVSTWHDFPYSSDCWPEKNDANWNRIVDCDLLVAIITPDRTSHGTTYELGASKALQQCAPSGNRFRHAIVVGEEQDIERNEWFCLHDQTLPKYFCKPWEAIPATIDDVQHENIVMHALAKAIRDVVEFYEQMKEALG